MIMNREKMLKAYPPMPASVEKRMDDTLLRLRAESAAHSVSLSAPRRRLCFVLVTALAVMMLAAATAAGIHYGVFDLMASLFGQEGVLPEAQQLVVSPLASAQLDNSVLTVEEAVYDGGNLRLVYSVRARGEALSPEEAARADGVRLSGCDWFLLNGEEYPMTNGSLSGSVLTGQGDAMMCYLDICLASSGIVPEGDLTVGLPLTDGEPITIHVPGYQVSAEPVETETAAVRATLLSASLSPVRAYARLRIARQPGASAESYEAALGDWRDACLVDAQGNRLCAPSEILTDAAEDGQWVDWTYIFPPVEGAKAYFAPTVVTTQDEWLVDMAHALPMQ